MRDHFSCGFFDHRPSMSPCGPDMHGPPGRHCGSHDFGHHRFGPFGPHFGPHKHGHGHHRHGHGPHRHGHGPHGYGHGPFGHHHHHDHFGPHRDFGSFGPRFWGPWGDFGRFGRPGCERPGCGEAGPSRGERPGRPEGRKWKGCCRGNKDQNTTDETVLVRGIVIERATRPNSV